jgi:hypothetical protein
MNKRFKFTVSAAVVAGLGIILTMTPAAAKPEYSKKEKTGCATCHVTVKSKELNTTGKCYSEKKSLTECKKE